MREPPIRPGDVFTASRVISLEAVTAFGHLVDDHGPQHDGSGGQPAVVHGLLIASLPFALTARVGYIGTSMTLRSTTPAFAGSTLTTRVEVDEVTPHGGLGWRARLSLLVTDERGREVLTGESVGIVVDDD
jgi:acyl dehydratase